MAAPEVGGVMAVRTGRGRGRRVAALSLAAATMLPAGCDSGRTTAERVISDFAESVQSENLDALSCLLAGAVRPGEDPERAAERRRTFDEWARGRYAAYLSGRDHGGVDLEEDGIVLVKAFALGKGTYYEIEGTDRPAPQRWIVDTEVRFAYGEIEIAGLPPGTVFYLCGLPLGRIESVKIPNGPAEVRTEVLETVVVRWTLVREPAAPPCPARWSVASVVPLARTATTRDITWEF